VLAGLPFEFINLNDIPELPRGYEVEEPATTFEGNAIIKAMTLGKKTGLLTLADDSGLEVDALGGAPGVYSARYAPGSDEDRYNKLLQALSDVPGEKRTARFRCVIALYDPSSDRVRTCDGSVEGSMLTEPRGTNGFGYDPIFFTTELQKTMAQATLEEKNTMSHRGRALQKARAILQNDFL